MRINPTIAPVAALLLAVALLLTGNGLQGTLLPVRAELEAFGTFSIGVLGASYFLGFALGCVFGPQVVRQVGHIRTFTALTAIASAATLAHAMLVDPVAWWPLRAVTGFCFAGLYVVIESWLNERATNQTRGLIMSVYTIVNLTVITLGQLMIMLYDPTAFPLFALASILLSMAAVPVAMTRSEAPPPPPKTVLLRPQRIYRISPVGLMGSFSAGLAHGPFWTLGPVFALGIGLDTRGVAIFMSITVIAGALGQWPLGRLSDRIDRRKVIILACTLSAAGGVVLALSGLYWTQAVLYGAVLFGAFSLPIYSISVAHTNDFVDPGAFVETSSSLLLAYAAGAVLGPLLASGAMDRIGPAGLFTVTALVHAAMAAFALYRMRRRSALSPTERTAFIAVPGTSSVMAGLDPRADEALAERTREEAGPGSTDVVEAELMEDEDTAPSAPDEKRDG